MAPPILAIAKADCHDKSELITRIIEISAVVMGIARQNNLMFDS